VRAAVIVLPGSNCDVDAYHVLREVVGLETDYVWHQEGDLSRYDLLVIPGGFSYGDYLRAGAIAKFSPAIQEAARAAAQGRLVLGICNGFQVLLETGLLPGAMRSNESMLFRCRFVHLRVENTDIPFTHEYKTGAVLRIPVAHGEGNYYADAETLQELQEHGQVVFRYVDETGAPTAAANPNGSLANIAGICNREGNVLGMMPHPERCAETILGSQDGRRVFTSALAWWRNKGVIGRG
jgi:phosphoribosylformylglycinamidine synthase I